MQISPVSVNSNCSQRQNPNKASFQANLKVTRAAKEALKADMKYLYEQFPIVIGKGKPLDFEGLFNNFKKSIETETKDIDGTIKLTMSNDNKNHPKLGFVTPDGEKYYGRHIDAYDILPDKENPNSNIIRELASMVTLQGKQGTNAFSELLFKITCRK